MDGWYTNYAVKYSMIKDCKVDYHPINKSFNKNCCIRFQTTSFNLNNIASVHICKKFTGIEDSLPL